MLIRMSQEVIKIRQLLIMRFAWLDHNRPSAEISAAVIRNIQLKYDDKQPEVLWRAFLVAVVILLSHSASLPPLK
jgi:hypothetical protein